MSEEEKQTLITNYGAVLEDLDKIITNLNEAIIDIDKGAYVTSSGNFDDGKVKEYYDSMVTLRKNIKQRILDLSKSE